MEALFLILHDENVNEFLPWFPVKDIDEARHFYEAIFAGICPEAGICIRNMPEV